MSKKTVLQRKIPVKYTIAYIVFSAFIYIGAHADTAFVEGKPSSGLTTIEASKLANLVKCDDVIIGSNMNPVKRPGTSPVWLKILPKGVDDVSALLASNKKAFRCSDMYKDATSGRLKKTK